MCTNMKNLWSKSTTTQEEMKIKNWKHVAIFLVRILHVKKSILKELLENSESGDIIVLIQAIEINFLVQ